MLQETHTSRLVTDHVNDPISYHYPNFNIPKNAYILYAHTLT